MGRGVHIIAGVSQPSGKDIQLLNVSHTINAWLCTSSTTKRLAHLRWKQEAGDNVVIRQSHGGSGKRRRLPLLAALKPDVVTGAGFTMWTWPERGRIDKKLDQRLPDNSAPHLHHRFLVRKAIQKQIYMTGTI